MINDKYAVYVSNWSAPVNISLGVPQSLSTPSTSPSTIAFSKSSALLPVTPMSHVSSSTNFGIHTTNAFTPTVIKSPSVNIESASPSQSVMTTGSYILYHALLFYVQLVLIIIITYFP